VSETLELLPKVTSFHPMQLEKLSYKSNIEIPEKFKHFHNSSTIITPIQSSYKQIDRNDKRLKYNHYINNLFSIKKSLNNSDNLII